MGAAALAVLWYTNGNVSKLVVLYSINVFITFTLSQFAMAKHWWQVKAKQADWYKRFAINGIGTLLTGTILITTTIIKFTHGGWVTLVVTGSLVALCYSIYKHYDNVKLALRRLDDLLVNLPLNETCIGEPIKLDTEGPTAVLLVKNYDGLGIHAIFSIMRLFRTQKFKNLLFISVGHINAPHFTDHEEINKLRSSIEYNLDRYVDLAQRMGYYSERRYALGTDRVAELEKLCSSVSNDFIEPVFFCGKLIFAEETSWTAFLHNQTPMEIQRRLMFAGFNTVVVPVRVL
jgi:K+ transporter